MKKTIKFPPASLVPPALLVLVLLLSGCGLLPSDPLSDSNRSGQALPGGVVVAPAWKVAQTATSTMPVPATSTSRLPTIIHSPTASATAIPAPSETPTPVPPALDPACLVGTWEAANLAQAMAESITLSGGSLTLEGVEGQAQYLFYPDGTMEIRYQQLAAAMTGIVDSREVRVVHTLDGSGSAHYAPDPLTGEILLSGFGGDGINTSLSINGQVLAEGSLPVWQAFSAGPGETDASAAQPDVQTARTVASCEGDALTLQAVDPLPGQAVNLFRTP